MNNSFEYIVNLIQHKKAVDDLADRLNQIMAQRGLKASEVADGAGITRPVMSRYLANRSGISAENLIKLSQYLNVSPDWLLNGSDAPESIKMSKSVSVWIRTRLLKFRGS